MRYARAAAAPFPPFCIFDVVIALAPPPPDPQLLDAAAPRAAWDPVPATTPGLHCSPEGQGTSEIDFHRPLVSLSLVRDSAVLAVRLGGLVR
jgi:hypothetical protein